jgi:quercetin dioxygenase-like cupin family protein
MTSASPATTYPPIIEGFGYSPSPPALWRSVDGGSVEFRDLGLESASRGLLNGRHLRAPSSGGATLALQPSPFVFFFVLEGDVTLAQQARDPIVLDRYAAATRYGSGPGGTITMSPGAQLFEMQASEAARSDLGLSDADLGDWVITRESEDAYVLGEGPRRYFRYRDLGMAQATHRRLHIHVVASTGSVGGGTGWHSHTMGQIFYVLKGWADLAVKDKPWVKMRPHDAMCLHPGLPHDVPAFSDDYLVLELCVPADYDTTDAPAPAVAKPQ